MILITGAAGKTGAAIIKKLLEKNNKIRAWVYKENYKQKFTGLKIDEFIIGDMRSKSLWKKAVLNISGVYHICSNMNPYETEIGNFAVQAAEAAGVQKFVFHSVLHPQTEKMPHHWNKMRVEELLFESNLNWTILQPAPYMRNILAYKEQIINTGFYPIPYPGSAVISLVDLNDAAEAAVKVLTEPGHSNAVYELTGEEALSQDAVAEILTEKIKKTVLVKETPLKVWAEKMRAAGMDSRQVNYLIKMFEYYKEFNLKGNSNTLKWLLKRPPLDLKSFIENNF